MARMKIARILLLLCGFILLLPAFVRAGGGNDRVRASLLASVSSLRPGETFQVGVRLKIAPGWHIYWANPGDSGLATSIKLDLPPGFFTGAVEYPIPTRLDSPGDIVNYIYENEVMLMVPVTVPKDWPVGSPVKVTARVAWLVCQDVCLPGNATLTIQLPTSDQSQGSVADLFVQWNRRLPADADPERVAGISEQISGGASKNQLSGSEQIRIHWKVAPKDIQWFPGPSAGLGPTNVRITTIGDMTTISFQLDQAKHAALESVLAYTISNGTRMGLNIRSGLNSRSPVTTQPG